MTDDDEDEEKSKRDGYTNERPEKSLNGAPEVGLFVARPLWPPHTLSYCLLIPPARFSVSPVRRGRWVGLTWPSPNAARRIG